jgi:hypothetical protein
VADKRIPHNWENVKPGDIISFKYKSQSSKRTKLQTILVLNPSLKRRGQKRTSTQLIGIKIEESNKTKLQVTQKPIQIFEQIGNFVPIDEKNNLYRLNVKSQFITNDIKGVKPRAFDLLSKGLGISEAYRTYDYYVARRSSVFLEPIRLFTKLDEKVDDKPQQPEPPKQPEKPGGGINEN